MSLKYIYIFLKRSNVINDSFCFRVLCICGNITHLATGSLDRTVKIWLLQDGKLWQTLIGHTKGVWALKFLSTILLVSGAYDATIKV
jgi:WD40 repeat protein